MFLHCGFVLMFVSCVRTTEYIYDHGIDSTVTEYEQRFSYWPSVHNAFRLRKRDVAKETVPQSENGVGISSGVANSNAGNPVAAAAVDKSKNDTPKQVDQPNQIVQPSPSSQPVQPNLTSKTDKPEEVKLPLHLNETVENPVKAVNESTVNGTSLPSPKPLDIHNPGVVMRALTVFGGFSLLAVAYYIFYRRKGNKTDMNNAHNANDANQFRYGVLQSDDRRDNMELSRVPLTLESDDDDNDDLEIFDLEQKKKSLSYVNLQTSDEDVVFQNSTHDGRGTDKDNLLLDIEDSTTDTLINWSNIGSKSIL